MLLKVSLYRLAQSVKLSIAVAIFLTYTLQFYVPMEIIWKNVKGNFNEHKNIAEYSIRISLVVCIGKTYINIIKQIMSMSFSLIHRSSL